LVKISLGSLPMRLILRLPNVCGTSGWKAGPARCSLLRRRPDGGAWDPSAERDEVHQCNTYTDGGMQGWKEAGLQTAE